MDNRLRFLYCNETELWGRMWRAQAQNGKLRVSEVGVQMANPLYRPEDVIRTEIKVGKCVSHVPRKAAIVFIVPVP
jgi:hypothetical protein